MQFAELDRGDAKKPAAWRKRCVANRTCALKSQLLNEKYRCLSSSGRCLSFPLEVARAKAAAFVISTKGACYA